MYILSNYGKWTYEHTAEALSFLSDVDGQVFSFEVHQIKPEPEIYRTLLDKFNLVADECVFLDDRRENIEAAETQVFIPCCLDVSGCFGKIKNIWCYVGNGT